MNILELSEQEIGRRQSLQELRDMGINPYPAEEFAVSATSDDIKANFKDDEQREVTIRFYISKVAFMRLSIPIPPLSVQKRIVEILDKFTTLEAELEAELDCRKRQYEYYRNQLLSFDMLNRGGKG